MRTNASTSSATAPAYTEGPWNYRPVPVDSAEKKELYWIDASGGVPIASIRHDYGMETVANARLIAAAPELLRACKDAVYALNQIENTRLNPEVGVHKNTYSVCSMLDRVIAKAYGHAA